MKYTAPINPLNPAEGIFELDESEAIPYLQQALYIVTHVAHLQRREAVRLDTWRCLWKTLAISLIVSSLIHLYLHK